MKKTILCIIMALMVGIGTSVDADAQRLKSAMNLGKQRAEEQKRIQEEQRLERLRQEQIEKDFYEEMCRKGTLDALKRYKDEYPNGKYIEDANSRIAEFDLWDKAKTSNTKAAYQEYLAKSQSKSFKSEADKAIALIEMNEMWAEVKDSKEIAKLETFVKKYPNSENVSTAQKRIHQLKGVQFYNEGKLLNAYEEFKSAGGRESLEYANRQMFDDAAHYYDYNQLGHYPTVSQLVEFYNKYPNSKYRDEVSNKIALEKAKQLGANSTESDFTNALSYAKDSATKENVESYISFARVAVTKRIKEEERQRKQLEREWRIDEWKENGGLINLCINFMDMGLKCQSSYLYYDLGLGLRIGNYKTPLQFEFGVAPGIGFDIDEDDVYEDEDSSLDYNGYDPVYFRMPIYTKLSVNIAKRLYIDGGLLFNVIRNPYIEPTYCYRVGLGCHWRNVDWNIINFSGGFGNKKIKNYFLLGMGLTWNIRLW